MLEGQFTKSIVNFVVIGYSRHLITKSFAPLLPGTVICSEGDEEESNINPALKEQVEKRASIRFL